MGQRILDKLNDFASRGLPCGGVRGCPDRTSNVLLLYTNNGVRLRDAWDFLKTFFDDTEGSVSIYATGGVSEWDFLVCGEISERQMESFLSRAEQGVRRFRKIAYYAAARRIYHTQRLELPFGNQRNNRSSIEYLTGDKAIRDAAQNGDGDLVCFALKDDGSSFWGAVFFHIPTVTEEDAENRIRAAISAAGVAADVVHLYCRLNLDGQISQVRDSDKWNDMCLAIVQKPCSRGDAKPQPRDMEWLHAVCDAVRTCGQDPPTGFAHPLPLSPRAISREFVGPLEICKTALSTFVDRAPMCSLMLESEKAAPTNNDGYLPLGNFLVSAGSGSGKARLVAEIVKGFAEWDGILQESPGITRFDVLYVNFKPINKRTPDEVFVGSPGEPTNVGNAVVGSGVVEYKKKKWSEVLSAATRSNVEKSLIVYSEIYLDSFGWGAEEQSTRARYGSQEHAGIEHAGAKLGEVVSEFQRLRGLRGPKRGVVVVLDELKSAVRSQNELLKVFVGSFIDLVRDNSRSEGIRVVVVWQGLADVGEIHQQNKWLCIDEFARSASVLLGTQTEKECSAANFEEYCLNCQNPSTKLMDTLQTGNLSQVRTLATKLEKEGRFCIGPFIAVPRLYKNQGPAFPVPCNIYSPSIPRDFKGFGEVRWDPD